MYTYIYRYIYAFIYVHIYMFIYIRKPRTLSPTPSSASAPSSSKSLILHGVVSPEVGEGVPRTPPLDTVKKLPTDAPCTLHPAPCTLHPAPCTLHPAPCTLHPAPCTTRLSSLPRPGMGGGT